MKKNTNSILLNNDTYMPPIGYGVFRMTNEKECEEAVLQALNTGHHLPPEPVTYFPMNVCRKFPKAITNLLPRLSFVG